MKTISNLTNLDTSTKFIIISYSRTGSSFLVSLLNDHPNIKCDGELLREVSPNPDYSKLLNNIFNVPNKTQGFKLFYYHPINVENKQLFETIQEDKSIKIIFLERTNLLRREYSRLKANQTNVWRVTHQSKQNHDKTKIHIDINRLIAKINNVTNSENLYKQMFQEHKHITIQYEDLENNNRETCKKIFHFLDVHDHNVNGNTIKQNPGVLKDLIENYNEIETHFNLNSHQRVILD